MSKRAELREKRRRSQQRQRVVWIGVFAVLAVALIFLFVIPNLPKSRPPTQGLSMGEVNAPVKVEEFSDFQCPACGQFYNFTEPDIVEEYVKQGKVQFTYIPLSFLGPESVQAAKAAYCANDQIKFWDYHDILFENQSGENQGAFADRNLIDFAEELDLDVDAFTQCLQSDKYDQTLAENDQYSKEVGATFTPSFVVNGQLVSLDQLETAIDSALGE